MVRKNIRLVVSDMDGTLLGPDKRVSAVTREAIKRAERAGIRFSICTGRIQTMTEYYLGDLQLTTPVITANGALIWDPAGQKALWDQPMDEEELLSLLLFCREHQLDYCALTMGTSYFAAGSVRRKRFEQYNEIARSGGFAPMSLALFDDAFACIRGQKVYKVLINEVVPGQFAAAAAFIDTLKTIGYTSSEDRLLDVADRNISKGEGLKHLAQLLDIPTADVCAVGDYDNDIPMLRASGFPVAMANGCEAIRNAAEFVTKANTEDGVAYLLDQLLLEDR